APRLFGGFSFQPGHVEDSVWDLFPDALFILPRFQLTQNNDQTWLTITLFLDSNIPTEEFNTHFTAYAQEYSRLFSTSSNLFNNQSHSRFTPLPYDDLTSESSWITAVSHALTEIESGSIEKVVLARARQLRMDKPFDPMLSLAELGRRYPECIQFFFEPEIGTAFYGATPELLAKTSEKTITTVALAGSIHRGETPTEDDFLAQSLMASSKDRHEHQVVVQSIKQRLAEFSTDIHISPNPEILKLNNIQHLQTNITARIKSQYNVLSAVNAMHPTPAVGGLPQQTALKIIKKIEPHTRGWYAAPIGWLSLQGAGEFAVAIRSAVTSGPLTRLYAGAGIVSQSDPHKEWHETALKFIPLMTALESAVAS
ncbi:MAG: isochorismate synthase, partial [Anaerolineae bacterium]|nr:isochorismate synthase [Anaerolineae bacterium]